MAFCFRCAFPSLRVHCLDLSQYAALGPLICMERDVSSGLLAACETFVPLGFDLHCGLVF